MCRRIAVVALAFLWANAIAFAQPASGGPVDPAIVENLVAANRILADYDRFIHGEIYKARPDVNAVVHTHSPAVIPFVVTQVPMRSMNIARPR
jgi:ribulose-5-phosphate 4-epimerase/fuculose-1-phosphate aldolase